MAYIRFPHQCDQYVRNFITGNSGQKKQHYTYNVTTPVMFIPFYASERLNPAYESLDKAHLFLPNDLTVDYGDRWQNFVDRFGNIISPGPFQIQTLQLYPGFNGSIRHIHLIIERIKET